MDKPKTSRTYSEFFNIDPLYLPAVTDRAMRDNPDLWKNFYPHDAFVKLMKDTISVLTRKQKVSIWVEGVYGVGKSHAVLTLRRILDASEEETRAYFEENKDYLSTDLLNSFLALKSPDARTLTVHRYGSSNIDGDDALFTAIQESVARELAERGIDVEEAASASLKMAAIRYLEGKKTRVVVESVLAQEASLFDGAGVDELVQKLKTESDSTVQSIMAKLAKIDKTYNINVFRMSANDLIEWLKTVINKTPYNSILFIWDEFTEYFLNNSQALTGFQDLAEAAGTFNFYFMIVTHVVQALKAEVPAVDKIAGRFIKPTAQITLPDNIAFQLAARAMRLKDDEVATSEWRNKIKRDLARKTEKTRAHLIKKVKGVKLTDDEFIDVLPLHPYAALVLKHISTAFAQNQRSMFDFIKNDRGDEIKAFQWFIKENGPYQEPKLFTVDMLWDFFYVQGRSDLDPELRGVLDTYARFEDGLDEKERRVLKTILILSAISQGARNDLKAFLPTQENLKYVFEGSSLPSGDAEIIADDVLVKKFKILYTTKLGTGETMYSVYLNAVSEADMAGYRTQIDKKKTLELVSEKFDDKDSVGTIWRIATEEKEPSLALRYEFAMATVDTFKDRAHDLIRKQDLKPNKIYGLVCFAKTRDESATLFEKIRNFYEKYNDTGVVVLDATGATFDEYKEYREHAANALRLMRSNKDESGAYLSNAQGELKKWRDHIMTSTVYIYDAKRRTGQRAPSFATALDTLKEIDAERFPFALEVCYPKIYGLYDNKTIPMGVEYGVTRKEHGVFNRTGAQQKLSQAFAEAFHDDRYWENLPSLPISQIKIEVERIIRDGFAKEGRIAIGEIYDVLEAAPFGMMRCNFTAYVMGILLREYVDGSYEATDTVTSSTLDLSKLKEIVKNVMERDTNPKYKEQYIASMSEREKAFVDASARIFRIERADCASIEKTCQLIRAKTQNLAFPLWTLKYLPNRSGETWERAKELIDRFRGLLNPAVAELSATTNDHATKIGEFCQMNPETIEVVAEIATKECTNEGMKAFLTMFEDGRLLKLADTIKDSGRYMSTLHEKFNADAANWVWKQETAEQMIREVILEYEIVAASNRILPQQSTSYSSALNAWRDACGQIRVSWRLASPHLPDLTSFFTTLDEIATTGSVVEEHKSDFLAELRERGDVFKTFYHSQAEIIETACQYYLKEVNYTRDDLKAMISSSLLDASFTMEESDYRERFKESLRTWSASKEKERLRTEWRDKTGTESPRAWSKGRMFPIQLLLPAEEWDEARNAIELANGAPGDEEAVSRALKFLANASFYADMLDSDKLDKIFREKILEDYSVLFPSLDEVKKALAEKLSPEPYDWYGHTSLNKVVKELAESAYKNSGVKLVGEKIKRMDANKAKEYLLKLVSNNFAVGVQIMKDE